MQPMRRCSRSVMSSRTRRRHIWQLAPGSSGGGACRRPSQLCTSTPKPSAWANSRGRSPISPGPGVRGRRYRPHYLGVLRELSEVCLDMAVKAANVVESHGDGRRGGGGSRRRSGSIESSCCISSCFVLSAGIDVDAAIDLTLAARCLRTICRACCGGRDIVVRCLRWAHRGTEGSSDRGLGGSVTNGPFGHVRVVMNARRPGSSPTRR